MNFDRRGVGKFRLIFNFGVGRLGTGFFTLAFKRLWTQDGTYGVEGMGGGGQFFGEFSG